METNLLLVGLFVAVAWYGGRILKRLPKPQHHQEHHEGFTFADYEHFVHFRIDALTENDFDVSFVDDWNTGRPFMLYGPLKVDEDNDDERRGGLEPKERVGVHVHPTARWFKQSRIGYIRVYQNGGWECHISLPYQIARHVLEDVRRNPDQIVSIGFAKTCDGNGKAAYPIYSFELSEAFD